MMFSSSTARRTARMAHTHTHLLRRAAGAKLGQMPFIAVRISIAAGFPLIGLVSFATNRSLIASHCSSVSSYVPFANRAAAKVGRIVTRLGRGSLSSLLKSSPSDHVGSPPRIR